MAQIATVTGVVGTVFAIAPDGTVRTLKVGDTLQKGEILRTGANARVELAMADGTVPAAASAAAGNVAIGANAIVKVDENMALGDARPTAQEAAVGIEAIQQVLQALEAGGDLNEELEAAAAGLTGGEGAGSDFVQLSRVQLETGSLSYDYNTVQGEQAELLDTGLEVLPEITLAVVTPPGGGGGGDGEGDGDGDGGGLDASGTWVQIEGTGPGADAGQTITLQLNLSRQSGTAITVDYEWVGGTATAGDDYIVTPRTGTITIPPNTTSVQITVDIARDALVEGDETFSLQLSNPRGGTLGNASVAITLVDDDIEVTASSESLDETGGSEAAGFGSVQGTLAVNYLGSGTPPVVALAADNATWDASTGTLTDNAGGWVVQMAADQTSYTFTQLRALSHPDSSNPDDPLDIDITATVTTAVVVAGVTYPSTATDTFIVTVLDDGPAVQASVGVTLDEADLGTVTVAGPVGSVDTGKLVAFGSIAVDSAAGLNKVSGSPMTTGDGNRTRVVDADTQTQLVQVKNPTTQAIEFEWRDTRTGEVYAKGQVASGEVLYLATTDNSIGQSVQLFVRFEGDTTWTGRSRGTLAGESAPSATFVVPSDATAVGGSGAGGGGTSAAPAVLEGQLNFDAGADGGRITALSAESLTGLTSGGEPVEFTSTESAGGSSITLTGTAGGEGVLTVEVNAATGAYTATLLGPLDHARPNLTGAADPLILELGFTVTDGDGDTATGAFTVTVLDDAPTARADVVTQPAENAPISTNVLANDRAGADGATLQDAVLRTGTGSVSFNASGEITYTPSGAETGVVLIDYTLTDGDGDTSTATLSITLLADSAPTIVLDTDGGVAKEVFESALLTGSGAGSGSDTLSGTLAIPTGDDTLASLVVNGQNLTLGGAVDTAAGTFSVSLGTDGIYTWTYTLLQATTEGRTDSETISLLATDSDGSEAALTFTIGIVDDVPVLLSDAANVGEGALLEVVEEAGVLANDTTGADTPAVLVGVVAGGGAGASINTAVGAAVEGQYGTLVLNANGSYTYQARANAITADAQDTFSYTVQDADGDLVSTTLTIHVADVTVTGTVTTGAVDEAGLNASATQAQGSNAASESETFSGALNLQPGWTAVTATGSTANGTYTINANGTFSYTLTRSFLNTGAGQEDSQTDTFTYTAQDAQGNTTTNTVTMTVRDDMPVASNDAGGTLVEDGAQSTLSGNVLDNDTGGADGLTGMVWNEAANADAVETLTQYGTLNLEPDGTWSYTLDSSQAATQALSADAAISVSLGYQITDRDGDARTAQLTLQIRGSGDTAMVRVPTELVQVNEAGLRGGSNERSNSEEATGTFTVTATDGIASISVGGTTFTLAELQALAGSTPSAVVDTGQGSLVLNGATMTIENGLATSAAVDYSYTLKAAQNHTQPDNDLLLQDVVAIEVTGRGGSEAQGAITIAIADDVPESFADVGSVAEGALLTVTAADGVLKNDTAGADGSIAVVGVASTVAGASVAPAGTAVQGQYGTLVLNADGSYTYQARANAITADAQDTFTYTVRDADGDLSSATLTLNVGNNTPATVEIPPVTLTVNEAGLLGGSNASSTSETATGTVRLNVGDDVASITVGGVVFTQASLVAFNSGTPAQVETDKGTLQVTGATPVRAEGGTITAVDLSYSYTLKAAQTHTGPGADSSVKDVLDVEVQFNNGGKATSQLVVTIVDDVPVAVADAGGTVVEDTATALSGNVLSNDISGADTSRAFVGWSSGDTAAVTALNSYGTLVQGADGSWSYQLDNSRAATQALGAGAPLSYTLNYTMRDADGDESSAQLTIRVQGAADGATVSTPLVGNAGAQVFEAGLTSDDDVREGTTGAFTVSATDGIATVTVGGQVLTLAELNALGTAPRTIDTGEGTLVLRGYNASTGVVNYSYALKATIDNDSKAGATDAGFDDAITISVQGLGGSTAERALTVRIVDDAPQARTDVGSVAEGALLTVTAADGVLRNDTAGADGPVTVVGVVAGTGTGTGTGASANTAVGTAVQGQYGTLVLNANGSYTYQAKANAITADAQDTFTYTVRDADGDLSSATLTLNVANNTPATVEIPPVTLTVNEAGLLGGSNASSTSETATGTVRLNVGDDVASITVGGVVFTQASLVAFNSGTPAQVETDKGTLQVTGATLVRTGSVITAVDLSYSYTLKAAQTHTEPGADSSVKDVLDVEVQFNNGGKATSQLVVTIVDDVPVATVSANDAYVLEITNMGEVSANRNNSFGYYVKAADGTPTTGVVVWSNVKEAVAADGLERLAVTVRGYTPDQIGFFLISDGGRQNPSLKADDPVVFSKDASGSWQATVAGSTEPLKTLPGSPPVLFDDTALNLRGVDYTLDNPSVPGNMNWEDQGEPPFLDNDDANLNVVWTSSLPMLQTSDANTQGAASDSATSAANLGGAFTFTSTFGADGAAATGASAVAYALSVAAGGATGLTQNGVAVVLVLGTDGVLRGVAGDDTPVFTISVDNAGVVTLTQLEALDHPGESADSISTNNSANLVGLPFGLVFLTATQTVTDGDGDTATQSAQVDIGLSFTFRDDAPAVLPSAGVTLQESGEPPLVGGVDTGKLLAYNEVAVVPGAGLNKVVGSLMTLPTNNSIGVIDPVTGNQVVQVRNPTEQAVEFEWRDSRTAVPTIYASGTVGSGEALFMSITDYVGGPPTIVLFVRPVGGGEFAPRPSGQGTVAGPASATQDFVVGDNTPAPGTGTGTGSTDFTPVTATGQLSFDPGADGARITALTVTALSTWTAAGKPVVFAQTPTTEVGGTLAGFITLTGSADGKTVLTVEVNTATGDYEVTLLAPLDHPPAAGGTGTGVGTGTAPPLKLELGYTVTDGDGDQATGTAEIQVLDNGGGVTPPPPPPPPLEGAVQVAEATTQDFTGTAGADVFRWTLADSIDPSAAVDRTGTMPTDRILEFGESGTDVLDLSDLLDQPGSAVLVEENGDNTEVTVTGTKGGDAFSQTIVLINFQDGASGNAIKTALDNDGFYKSQEP